MIGAFGNSGEDTHIASLVRGCDKSGPYISLRALHFLKTPTFPRYVADAPMMETRQVAK